MYTYEVRRGTSPSRKGNFDYIKIKIVSFIISFGGNCTIRFKSKKGASVSEEFALFNWSSVGQIRKYIPLDRHRFKSKNGASVSENWLHSIQLFGQSKYCQYLINHHGILKLN